MPLITDSHDSLPCTLSIPHPRPPSHPPSPPLTPTPTHRPRPPPLPPLPHRRQRPHLLRPRLNPSIRLPPLPSPRLHPSPHAPRRPRTNAHRGIQTPRRRGPHALLRGPRPPNLPATTAAASQPVGNSISVPSAARAEPVPAGLLWQERVAAAYRSA